MLSNLLSILYLCVFIAVGFFCVRAFFSFSDIMLRVWMCGVLGLLLLLWLPALFSFVFGFTMLSQLLALILCAFIGMTCFIVSRKKTILPADSSGIKDVLYLFAPLFLFGFALFLTHIICPEQGALHVGQSTFGDLPLHLGLVTSIGEQGFFPPAYSIYPGAMVGYPFLCDSVSATFYVLGASLRFAMLLPAIYAYALVLLGVYYFFEGWLKTKRLTTFATLLFFLGGGLGFAYFFDLQKLVPDNFSRIFQAFYQTPTNNIDVGIKWVNPIADMLIPQRATLFGWALLFPCLYLLRRAAFDQEAEYFVPLGIIAGALPLVHTHSFLALGILSAIYLFWAVFKRDIPKKMLLGWLWYGLIAIVLAAPQLLLFTFKQSESFLKFNFNWANETDGFLWFYIKNLGLLFILLPLAFFRLDKKDRIFYSGALAIWILSEFIQFQPNPYDNNKLLFIWFAFTCGIVAKLLLELYDKLVHFKGRAYFASLTLTILFLSGILTLGREIVSDYELFSKDEVEASSFVMENTAPTDTFLTASNHNNAVASLTGRNILCGTGSYLYFHGLDYSGREQLLRLLFEQPEEYFAQLSEQYNINYVWISDYERYNFFCDLDFFYALPVVFQNETVTIFRVE